MKSSMRAVERVTSPPGTQWKKSASRVIREIRKRKKRTEEERHRAFFLRVNIGSISNNALPRGFSLLRRAVHSARCIGDAALISRDLALFVSALDEGNSADCVLEPVLRPTNERREFRFAGGAKNVSREF